MPLFNRNAFFVSSSLYKLMIAGSFCGIGMFVLPAVASADNNAACVAAREYAMGVRYQQQSAEISALQLQTYALATKRLHEIIHATHGKNAFAIMTDLDETVIDNTAYAVKNIMECRDFSSKTWSDWERHGHPRLIPGAKEFLLYAATQGVTIFYVSDRSEQNRGATLATIRQLGLPEADNQHLLLKGPSKQVRRQAIEDYYTLVMQLGDTLTDFAPDFGKVSLDSEHQLVQEHAVHFGKDWFILPNASYGRWSKASLSSSD